MAMCGWCQGSGQYQGKTCVCTISRKPYFPPKKKRREDMIPSGHKHSNDRFLYETKTAMWFDCGCGQTFKVAL